MKFENNVKKYRIEAGLTQEELSKSLGMSRASINKVENGKQDLTVSKLYELSKILNVDPLHLLSEKSVVTQILLNSGFKESGRDQFMHKEKGRIFLNEYTSDELVYKLMSLGAIIQKKLIRDSLGIEDDIVFRPSV